MSDIVFLERRAMPNIDAMGAYGTAETRHGTPGRYTLYNFYCIYKGS